MDNIILTTKEELVFERDDGNSFIREFSSPAITNSFYHENMNNSNTRGNESNCFDLTKIASSFDKPQNETSNIQQARSSTNAELLVIEESHKSWRSGKWFSIEEEYAYRLMTAFFLGILPIPSGATLRGYLSVHLHCDPMRVSKKLTLQSLNGIKIDEKIGLRTFFPRNNLSQEEIELELAKVRSIRRCFWESQGILVPHFLPLSRVSSVVAPKKRVKKKRSNTITSSQINVYTLQELAVADAMIGFGSRNDENYNRNNF